MTLRPLTPVDGSIELRDETSTRTLEASRIAVVHEWLSARAGSEILFEQLALPFPSAHLFALTRNEDVDFDFGNRHVSTSPLDLVGKLRHNRALSLPMMPAAWKAIRREPYDVVVTSTHAFGREFFQPEVDGVHCNYVHAPMRYAWNPNLDTRGNILGPLGAAARERLRRRDLASVEHVDSFAANSTEIAGRIQEFYDRDAVVIPPPVDVSFFRDCTPARGEYLMAASRWIPYKRLDLAIRVGAELDMPVVIAGSGPEEGALRALAAQIHPHGVEFHVQPDRAAFRSLMANAAAFLFPPHEDFGIIAVEVQATGTPVVALRAGGALDTVRDGVTGALAQDQSVEAFTEATQRCLALSDPSLVCRDHAEQFSAPNFRRLVRSWVEGTVASSSSIAATAQAYEGPVAA